MPMTMNQTNLSRLIENRERMIQLTKELFELGYEGEELYETLIDELSDIPLPDLQECARSLIVSLQRQIEECIEEPLLGTVSVWRR